MTLIELQALLSDQDAFKRAFRKDETLALLKGQFKIGRTPYIHQVVFADGSQLRLKFYDTIKQILNTKGQPVYGKESFLSYLEVTVAPAGQKAYCYSVDVKQIVWGTSKSKATVLHQEALAELSKIAVALEIDLSAPTAWSTVYTENY
jgi:hypothetical protein